MPTASSILARLPLFKGIPHRDLEQHEAKVLGHPILRALAGEQSHDTLAVPDLPEEKDLDAAQDPAQVYHILDADSSQRLCLEAAAQGQSFAVQGAPGTGKSQTITNLIADCLGKGKTVLFVSPQLAALQIVHQRLQQAGLGGHCTAFHEAAGSPSGAVSSAARQTAPSGKGTAPALQRLREHANRLNQYAESLHSVRAPLQQSAWTALGELARLHAVPAIKLGLPPLNTDAVAVGSAVPVIEVPASWLDEARHAVQRLQQLWHIHTDRDHPWRGFKAERYTAQLRDDVIALVERVRARLDRLQTVAEQYADQLDVRGPLSLLMRVGELLAARPAQIATSWGREKDLATLIEDLQRCSSQYQRLGQARVPLTERYGPNIFRVPEGTAKQVEQAWHAAAPLLAPGDEQGAALLSHQQQLRGWAADTQKRIPGWLSDAHTLEKWLAVPLPTASLSPQRGESRARGGREADPSVHGLRQLLRLANLCQSDHPPERSWVHNAQTLQDTCSLIAVNKPIFASFHERRTRLRATYTEPFFELELARMAYGYAGPYRSWLCFFNGQFRRDRRAIRRRTHAFELPATVAQDVAVGRDLLAERARLEEESERRRNMLGRYEQGLDTDLEAAERATRVAGEAVELVHALSCESLPARLVDALCAGSPAPEKIRSAVKRLQESLGAWTHATQELKHVLPMASLPGGGAALEDGPLSALNQYARDLQAGLNTFASLTDPVLTHAPTRPPDAVTLIDDLRRADELRVFEAAQEVEGQKWRSRFGPGFQGVATDWEALHKGLAWVRRVRDLFRGGVLPDKLVQVASGQGAVPSPTDLRHAQDHFEQALHGLEHRFEPPVMMVDGKRLADHAPEAIKQRLTMMRERAGELADWIDYRHLPDRFAHLGLRDFWNEVQAQSLSREQLPDIFTKSFQASWVEAVVQHDPALRAFQRAEHEGVLAEFCQLDRYALQQAAVRLSGADVAQEKPCVLMNLLLVSEALPLDRAPFDVVVFDEASQIRTEDAVPAMVRGRQVIIFGDDQQLPPPATEGASDRPVSILDAWRQADLPQYSLCCHYRSRHESLIAFSNRHYYDNRLLTFPASRIEHPTLGVEFRRVAAGPEVDVREAGVVADLVLKHLRTAPEKSLGVITLDEARRDAIEEEIDRRLKDDPTLERFFRADSADGVFIKDVGAVQGEERDVILLAVGYGPHEVERMSAELGLFDPEVQHPWLNVAATRAREKLVVVSSLRASDLQPHAAQAPGVRLVQQFLDYAECGALDAAPDVPTLGHLEADIAEVLQQRGYQTVPLVGSSSQRVDVAVVDPEEPARFLMGILCDGPMYQAANTARDRDRLRPEVLGRLGWRLHHVWAPAWVQHRDEEIERLLRAVEQARSAGVPAPHIAGRSSSPALAVP